MNGQALSHLVIKQEPHRDEDRGELPPSLAMRLLDEYTSTVTQKCNSITRIIRREFPYVVTIMSVMIIIMSIFTFYSNMNFPRQWFISIVLIILFFEYRKFIVALFREHQFQKKVGIYYSEMIPLFEDQKELQKIVNESHHFMDSGALSSWEKIELAVKLKRAESAIVQAKQLINKYDPTLLKS